MWLSSNVTVVANNETAGNITDPGLRPHDVKLHRDKGIQSTLGHVILRDISKAHRTHTGCGSQAAGDLHCHHATQSAASHHIAQRKSNLHARMYFVLRQ
jgi:hypothetical protein